MTVGLHRVRVTNVAGAVADLDCEVTEVSIHHGRDAPAGQPEASSATIVIPFTALPPEAEVGSTVAVDTRDDLAAWHPRFAGRITDLAVTHHAGTDVPTPEASITAVGALATLGRRYVGDVPWPAELDGARVSRVLTLAGATVGQVDPGTVSILARDVDLRSAREVIDDASQSAGGVLWQTTAGLVSYADANHRRNASVAVTLDACDVLMAPVWTRNVEGLVNDVAVSYGVAPDGGTEQPTYATTSPDSIARFGRYAYALRTDLAALADATARAQLLVVRNSFPVWNLTALPLDLSILDDVTTRAVLALDMHSLVGLTGLPGGSPATSVNLWVEGWSETLRYGGHDLTLSVSGYCRTVPPPTWDEVPPSWTWDTVGGLVDTRNYVTNPSAEATSGTVVTRTNLILNPVAGDAARNGWGAAGAGGTVAQGQQTGQSGWSLSATTSYRVTWSVASSSVNGGLNNLLAAGAIVAGRIYSGHAQIRTNKVQRMRASLLWTDDAATPVGTQSDGTPVVTVANAVTTITVTGVTAPAGATRAYLILYAVAGASGTPWAAGDWLEATHAHVEETDLTLASVAGPLRTNLTGVFAGYFGAATYGPDFTYAWSGTANASTSVQRAPGVTGYQLGPQGVANQSSDRAYAGAKSIRFVAGTGTWDQSYVQWTVNGLTVGKVYTASVYVWLPTTGPPWKIRIGGVADGTNTSVRGEWVRLTATFTATVANGHRVLVASNGVSTVRGDDLVYTDGWTIEEGSTATDYFDGNTTDAPDLLYEWMGTAHASVSRRLAGTLYTWDTATCMGPLPSSGRWADVSASLRWDEVPPGTSWDQWKG